jgi:hypothetical protein
MALQSVALLPENAARKLSSGWSKFNPWVRFTILKTFVQSTLSKGNAFQDLQIRQIFSKFA